MAFSENEVLVNFTNSTVTKDPALVFGPKHDSYYIVIPITIIYLAIFVCGLFGNICTCIVITRNKSMHTATNYYLFSLAVSDLLLLVSGMPQEIWSIWSKWPYVFGELFCILRGLAAETSANASVLTITFFTVERYLAICHPFLSHTMSKLSRAIKHILMVWMISFMLALPQAMQFGLKQHLGVILCLQTKLYIPHSFEISTFLFFFTPMGLITCLYALIALRLSRNRIKRNRSIGRQSGELANYSSRTMGSVHKKHGQSTRRVVKMLVAVVTAFFLCWAPFHAQRLIAIYGTSENHQARSPAMLILYGIITYSSGVLYYLSTAVNPVLYHIMSNKFRDAFKRTLGCRCCGLGAHASGSKPRLYSPMVDRRHAAVSSTDNSGYSVRDETTSFTHGVKNKINKRKCSRTLSTGSERSTLTSETNQNDVRLTPYTTNLTPSKATHVCICPATSEDNRIISYENKIQKRSVGNRKLWIFLKCSANTNETVDPVPKSDKVPVHGTISNSSLMEAERRDLEEELDSWMEEMKKIKLLQ